MSHHTEAAVVCPNCGHQAENNYCSQCGQPTHLHKDTFLGLVTHFVAHYFHYDSKFWKTLKTLWLKPGALTVAYRSKQRMRYIDPFSLYIFVSAVFFLVLMKVVPDGNTRLRTGNLRVLPINVTTSGIDASEPVPVVSQDSLKRISWQDGINYKWGVGMLRYSRDKNFQISVDNAIIATVPKAIFFLIPVIAILLSLLFIRKSDVYFVDHGIFSMHFHTFLFSIMIIPVVLKPFLEFGSVLTLIAVIIACVYFVRALRVSYNIGRGRALTYAFVIGIVYSFILFAVLLALLAIMLINQVVN